MQLLSSCGNLDSRSRMGPVAEHNRAKHGDEEVEIEVKMRGRGHSGGWVSSLTLAIFAVYSSSGWVHRFTYGGPGAGFPGVAAVGSESAVYWRAGSHRASAAGKALLPDFLGSRRGQFTNSTRALSGLGPDQSLRDNRGPDQVCGEQPDGRRRRQYLPTTQSN